MFNKLFRKKQKAAEAYLSNFENYSVSQENWCLALSSIYVEGFNVGLDTDALKHDLIGLCADRLPSEIHEDLISHLIGYEGGKLERAIHNRLNMSYPCQFSELLLHGYAREGEFLEEYVKYIENNEPDLAPYIKYILKNKDKFKHQNNNLYVIISHMWCVRVACYAGWFDENHAWGLLNRLADETQRALAGYSGWQQHYQNTINGVNLDNRGYSGWQKSLEEAAERLVSANSPLNQIPYHNFIQPDLLDRIPPYNNLPTEKQKKGIYQKFQTVLADGTLEELLDLVQNMAENHSNALDNCIRDIAPDRGYPFEKIVDLPENHPDNDYAYLLRGNWYAHQAFYTRGAMVSSEVGTENYKLYYERLRTAVSDLRKAIQLLPHSPQAAHKLLEVLYPLREDVYEEREVLIQKIFEEFPNHTPSLSVIVNHATRKWGGSHEESFDLARKAIEQSAPDSNTPVLLFQAAFEHWFWHERFVSEMSEKERANEPQDLINADACLEDEELNAELDAYLPRLFKCMEDEDDFSVALWTPWLFMWYYLTEDRDRLKQVIFHAQGRYVTWQFQYLWNDAFRRGYINWTNYL